MARSRRSRRTLGLAAVAIVVLGVAAFAGWWFLFRDDAPPEADIDTAGETLDEAAGSGADGGSAAGGLEGTWTVDRSIGSFEDDFSSTWAGYRFEEQLAGIGASEAVGRTPDVTGTLTVAGDEVTAAEIQVDLTTLESDRGQRDNALRTRGLESESFPTATFRLTGPVTLPPDMGDGDRASVSATGELSIHGVTNPATVELEAELRGDAAVVVGNAPVALADYDIDPPTGFSVLSIADEGAFEFQLFFTRD